MIAAAVQFQPDRADPAGSRDRLLALAEEAALEADLVVLPEMAAVGYVFSDADEVRPLAERGDGPTGRALQAVAKAHGAWIVGGFAEQGEGALYNSAWVIDDQGSMRAIYRKTLLFPLDETWARPGDGRYPLLRTPFGRLGVGICMDLNDVAFTDWVAAVGLDVLAFPTNWLDQGEDIWDYWAWRLSGTNAVLVAANRWGKERGVPFRGQSAILQHDRVLAHAGISGDGIVRATLR